MLNPGIPTNAEPLKNGILKFPRFYRNKNSGEIVLFVTKKDGAVLKDKSVRTTTSTNVGTAIHTSFGFLLENIRSDLGECTDEKVWQPIDVILSNTLDFKEQGVIEIKDPPGTVGIFLGDNKFLFLIPENDLHIGEIDLNSDFRFVKLNISHTDGISIAGYQEKL